uniref:Pentatricopeptide repeat-containing protein n=1 Tax=Quercus lobata TaxID=97700 RepID=A0A7N2MSG5_QUELO
MKKFNVKPWVFLYDRIINALMRNGYVDLVVSVYDDFRNDGLVEKSVTFMVLIKGLCKVERIDEMLKKDKVEPDTMVYTTLVTVLCKCGRVEKGYELFREMKEKRCLIDRAIYGSLVEAFVADGKVGIACGLLKDLVDSGYRVDLGIYNLIIKGLCNTKDIDAAMTLVSNCLANVTSGPMEFKYTLSVIHACKSSGAEKVIEQLNEMTQ